MDRLEPLEEEERDFGALGMFAGVKSPRSFSARFRLWLSSAFQALSGRFCGLLKKTHLEAACAVLYAEVGTFSVLPRFVA